MRSELVNTSGKIWEILCDQIKINVIQGTGVWVGTEIHFTTGITLLLGDTSGQEKNLGKRIKVRDNLASIRAGYFANGHR